MLLIDYREGSGDLVDHPALTAIARKDTLDYGDALFAGNGPHGGVSVAIEIKSIADLISSIDTRRLQLRQIPGMMETASVVWVAAYGDVQRDDDGGLLVDCAPTHGNLPASWLWGVQSSLADIGVHLHIARDKDELGWWLRALYDRWQRKWESHKLFKGVRVTPVPAVSDSPFEGLEDERRVQVAAVAAQLPGVRDKRALACADHFESVEAMVAADEGEWMEVPGIGKGLAAKIVNTEGWKRTIRRADNE